MTGPPWGRFGDPTLSLTLLAFLAATGYLFIRIARTTDPSHVYLLDDPYIHMAIAKNLAQHGVWGTTQYGFAFASSSPLWILILSAWYAISGPNELAPLLLNLLFATLLVAVLHLECRRWGVPRWLGIPVSLMLVLAIPLFPLIFLGMEHSLHVLSSVVFLVLVARLVESPQSAGRSWVWPAVVGALMTGARYEGLFLAGCAGLVLCLLGRAKQGLLIVAASTFPVLAYALYAMGHGGSWLPNSVLLKGNANHPWSMETTVQKILAGLPEEPESYVPVLVLWGAAIVLLVAMLLLSRARLVSPRDPSSLPAPEARAGVCLRLGVFALTVPLHLHFAELGWLYRYEAYLVAIGLLSVLEGGVTLFRHLYVRWKGRAASPFLLSLTTILLVVALFYPMSYRVSESIRQTPIAARAIFEQPYQVGRFLHRYYSGRVVAVNDIGAVSYYSNARLVDLVGLGTNEVARQIRNGTFDFAAYCSQAEVEIAVVYTHWYPQPDSWLRAGSWMIVDRGALGGNVVSFFGLTPAAQQELIGHLRDFSQSLPSSVQQRGPFTRQ